MENEPVGEAPQREEEEDYDLLTYGEGLEVCWPNPSEDVFGQQRALDVAAPVDAVTGDVAHHKQQVLAWEQQRVVPVTGHQPPGRRRWPHRAQRWYRYPE